MGGGYLVCVMPSFLFWWLYVELANCLPDLELCLISSCRVKLMRSLQRLSVPHSLCYFQVENVSSHTWEDYKVLKEAYV